MQKEVIPTIDRERPVIGQNLGCYDVPVHLLGPLPALLPVHTCVDTVERNLLGNGDSDFHKSSITTKPPVQLGGLVR